MEIKKETFADDIQARILDVLRRILDENAIRADIGPASRLMEIGLTSMEMVALMLRVEAEFDITIPQVEITFENFQSVDSLKRMISRQTGARISA